MEKQSSLKRKNAVKGIAFGLIFGLAGLFLGYLGGKYLKSNPIFAAIRPDGAEEKILFAALSLFAIWLVIALHEAGHLAAGLAQGFRLALFTAGFLGIRGTERGVQFFFNKDLNLLGGLAATFPERLVSGPDLRKKFAWIVAAGPLTSLTVGIVSLVIGNIFLRQLHAPVPLTTKIGILFLLVTGIFSLLIFLVTSLPLPGRGFMTDGARFLSLLGSEEKALREEAGLSVAAMMGAGYLPGEYSSEMVNRLAALPASDLLGLNGHFIALLHYLDRGETERALPFARSIEANISVAPAGPFRRYYLKEVVFLYGFLLKDADMARSIWSGIQKGAEKDADAATFRVKAVLACLENKPETALAFVETGLKKLGNHPFLGQRRFEEKWLSAVRAAIAETKQGETLADPVHN